MATAPPRWTPWTGIYKKQKRNPISATGRIQYRTNKGVPRSLDALDWIALVTSHIPDPHQRMVRYYGRYSNASRGKRRQQSLPPPGTAAVDSSPRTNPPAERLARQRRRNWARLLKKIYEVDPLVCRRCGSRMEIIAFIEEWSGWSLGSDLDQLLQIIILTRI